jgi:hypothetical protein
MNKYTEDQQGNRRHEQYCKPSSPNQHLEYVPSGKGQLLHRWAKEDPWVLVLVVFTFSQLAETSGAKPISTKLNFYTSNCLLCKAYLAKLHPSVSHRSYLI